MATPPNPFQFDPAFLISALGATIIKIATSPYHSLFRSIVTVLAALFSAWAFTDAALTLLGLDPAIYRNPMAAVLALTGEGVMRFVIGLSANPEKALDLWRKVRGGK